MRGGLNRRRSVQSNLAALQGLRRAGNMRSNVLSCIQ
jgi:hypothetical protein